MATSQDHSNSKIIHKKVVNHNLKATKDVSRSSVSREWASRSSATRVLRGSGSRQQRLGRAR